MEPASPDGYPLPDRTTRSREPVQSTDRRRFLGAVGGALAVGAVAGLAGCAGRGGGAGRLTVSVTNEDEVSHLVGVTVTDGAGDVVEEVPPEEIQPGVGRTFTSDGYGEGEYRIAVAGEGGTAWKQSTRWTDLDACPSFVIELRLTRTDGVPGVVPAERCDGP